MLNPHPAHSSKTKSAGDEPGILQENCASKQTGDHTHSTAHYPGIISPIWHRSILYFTGDEIQHFELFQYQRLI